MRSHRLALAELRRITSAPMLRLALVALLVIPTLYAGLYLYANRDPYAAMDNVPAALVIEDRGATLADGTKLAVGAKVSDTLLDGHAFDWHVTSRSDAVQGVNDERYEFAVIVPPDFSAQLASVAGPNPKPARLEQVTNDANGYLTRTISNEVTEEIVAAVAGQLSSTAATKVADGLVNIHTQLVKASDGAQQLAAGADKLLAGQRELASGASALAAGAHRAVNGANALSTGAGRLNAGLAQLDQATAALPAQTARLANGAAQVAAGNAKVAAAGRQVTQAAARVRGARAQLGATLNARLAAIEAANNAQPEPNPSVTALVARARADVASASTQLGAVDREITAAGGQLNRLASGSAQVAAGARALAAAGGRLHSGIAAAHAGAGRLASGATQLSAGLTSLDSGARRLAAGEQQALAGTGQLAKGAHTLASGLKSGVGQVPNPSPAQRRALAQVMGAPVQLTSSSGAQAQDYGAGLAPFFLALSLWIGAYVLFLVIRPLSQRALAANQPGWRVAVSGWMTPALIAVSQALLVWILVLAVLKFDVVHPWYTLAFLGFASVTYAAILHVLAARFGAVGKFLGLVFMVLQLVSAGGTFPWQTLPGPLQVVHTVAPMSYVVDGLRHLMYGGTLARMPLNIGVLALYLGAALLLGSLAADRARIWTPARVAPDLQL